MIMKNLQTALPHREERPCLSLTLTKKKEEAPSRADLASPDKKKTNPSLDSTLPAPELPSVCLIKTTMTVKPKSRETDFRLCSRLRAKEPESRAWIRTVPLTLPPAPVLLLLMRTTRNLTHPWRRLKSAEKRERPRKRSRKRKRPRRRKEREPTDTEC